MNDLRWKKYPVLNDGFICLVDYMGDDSRIVQAARVSYGMDERENTGSEPCTLCCGLGQDPENYQTCKECDGSGYGFVQDKKKDRGLLRRLMNDGHTSPFEKVKFEFLVRVPMDCWRQWIRHRTADVNEYSTRYKEAIDSQQTTHPGEWRLQSQNNKQGSSGFLEEWPESFQPNTFFKPEAIDKLPGEYLSEKEHQFHQAAIDLYQERLELGIAREQARKDLPLSNYTEAYWGCNLHNIFNFLRLRMDSDAQLEIRSYANAMYEIIKQVCPIACEAFEDYVLHAKKFSRMEMEIIRELLTTLKDGLVTNRDYDSKIGKPDNMTDNEWKSFLEKLT